MCKGSIPKTVIYLFISSKCIFQTHMWRISSSYLTVRNLFCCMNNKINQGKLEMLFNDLKVDRKKKFIEALNRKQCSF